MIWTDKMCIRLIEAYKERAVLWDPMHEFFKFKNKREAAWEELATKFQTDDVEIRKKMNSLLSSFRRERRKAVKRVTGSCTEIVYKTNWFAFKSMLFLNERNRNYTTQDFEEFNISIIDEEGEKSINDGKNSLDEIRPAKEEMYYVEESFSEDAFPEDPLANYSHTIEHPHAEGETQLSENEPNCNSFSEKKPRRSYNFATREEVILKHSRNSNPQIRRPVFKSRNRDDNLEKALTALQETILRKMNSTTNEFMAFGNSVGMQLQQMPLEIAIQTQTDIQSIISNARLRYIRMNNVNL